MSTELTQMNRKQKIENDEEKEYKLNHENKTSPWEIGLHFTEPRESDYIDCQGDDHKIETCNIIKRITHLLTYYQQQQQYRKSRPQIHEYLSSLQNYDVPTFMEDWHQVQNNHLRYQDDVTWIIKSININCNDGSGCQYIHRYQRDRENEEFDRPQIQFDYKNIILMDELDAIHTIIFHSAQQQNIQKSFTNVECKNDDELDDETKDEQENLQHVLWNNQPQSVAVCSTEQIVWIIQHKIFDKLKPNRKADLIPYKTSIIKYIEEKKFDGNKLKQIGRKTFAAEIIKYLHNKKLNASLTSFYSTFMNYDTLQLFN
eukprot:483758_1